MVEMLVVIAIIGILAALLLPALAGGEKRAKRIVCETQLQQIGLAFQTFAHDHNSKFPMLVSTNDGGSREYVQAANSTNGAYYFGCRHFQTLAGTLRSPHILICPADVRPEATNFFTLQNSNISYFVGVTAQYDQPMSILAGDANLAASSPVVQGGGRLTWNRKVHEYKGNVLFADGHVEEWSDSGSAMLSSGSELILPIVGPSNTGGGSSGAGGGSNSAEPASESPPASSGGGNASSSSSTNHEPARGSPATNQPSLPAAVPASPGMAGSSSHQGMFSRTAGQSEIEVSNTAAGNVLSDTNSPAAKALPANANEAMMSPFDRELASFLREIIFGTYFLILLLLLLFTAYRVWRWSQSPARKRRR